MAAYAAFISLKSTIHHFLKYYDICLTLPSLKMLQLLYNQVESFEQFLNTSDSSSRKRMDDRFHQIAMAMDQFEDILLIYKLEPSERAQSGGEIDGFLDLDHVKQAFDAITASMQELQAEHAVVSPRDSSGKLVGLFDQYNQLKERIFLCRFVISIVGMAGNGKTTLAEEILCDFDIVEMFESRAWVAVGSTYDRRDVLLLILAQVDPDACAMIGAEEGDREISKYLERSLEGKRFLIVFDDVWDVDFWYNLEYLLPNNGDGSKVVLTTRSRELGDGAEAVFDMRLLSEEESWDLLRHKVFGEEDCPSELVKAGKKIAEYCDGLPLTIVAVSGLLSEADRTLKFWNEVAARKRHWLFLAAYDGMLEVLYPSYWSLSLQLRRCFLYMGVFPQDYKIPRSKIINLWIAEEGLLDPITDQYGQQFLFGMIGLEEFNLLRNTPEQVLDLENYAVEYLEDLASKTLVMVHQKSTTRAVIRRSWAQGIKTCGLHSSWWHLCHREATKRNVFYILTSLEDGVGEDIKGQTTLSIHQNVLFGIKDVYESMVENCASSARSLLCFGPYHQYQVPVCFELRSLQHLDALNIRFYKFPLAATELVELRYLALTCNGKVPPSISKLQKLKFLIIHQHFNIKFRGVSSYLPMEIWDMKDLRYMRIMGSDLPSGDSVLPNLSKLLHVSSHSCTKSVFEGLPNLRKLGIQIELTPFGAEPPTYFDHISLLDGLESLKCVVVNPDFTPKLIPQPSLPNFPSHLEKLTLTGLGCSWEEMSKIASLQKLAVLKLRSNAFRGPKWDFKEHRFVKLEYLLIEDCDLEKLEIGDESFDDLQYMCMKHCYKLKEIRVESELAISNIEIVDCNTLAEKQIKKAMLRCNRLIHNFSVHSSWMKS
ncbi:putative late blight resistance protein homolog R1A-10 [Salvia miltiorrhiza]|uniref:putative late blight resistance protein homolog R1A-10 n=1 Tax=Salvia miltiorrhiza TaxID=226208 RepID=UPI0025AD55AE|nr:putative late blight resistance protein homolog R1A-10 [Salvia miltiorrhiza]